MSYPFLKGHGTQNDFVLLPDHDGTVHGDLDPARVRALCDRRSGIGGDGVLRVLRRGDGWFMDYRNSDGSLSEMCGNGIRVFGLHLVQEGLADPSRPLEVDTRDGIKVLTFDGERITVDMGTPKVLPETEIAVPGHRWAATHVDVGNPHAVAFVDDLADAGALVEPPTHDPGAFPEGVNVEFALRRGPQHVAMRVHERGSGETMACGTGACAVMVAAAVADGAPRDTAYTIDQPGGSLSIVWTADDRVLMTGPAQIVARGTTDL
jgi:diaminopimelate epimerase